MPGKKILVVDDSREIRETIAKLILRPAGYETLTANDGLAGLQVAREQHPDLIISDLQMPGMTGIQLKRTLSLENILTPLILMTGEGSESIASEASLAGVSAYFSKPLDPDVLLLAVEQALKAERLRQERGAALQSLEKRVHQLETLQAVGRTLTGTLDVDQVLSRVVDAAVRLTEAEEGSLLLLDEHTGELTMRAARNFDDQFVRTFRIRSDDSLAGQVIRTGQPVLIGGGASPQKIKTAYFVHSLIYVPLKVQNRVIGVLGVDNRQSGRALGEGDLNPLSALADYAAIAIVNAMLFARTNSERQKLDTILQKTAEGVIVATEDGRIVLINAAARSAFSLPPTGLVGKPLKDVISQPELRDLFTRSAATQDRRAEIPLDNNRTLNAHMTPIEGIGLAVVMQDITHLKQLDRIKSEFVSAVSHDLRSPLTAILGYVELIPRVGPVTDQQREFIRRVHISVDAITSLITDLLDLGRIEAGFDTQKESTNLPLVVRYAVEGLMPAADIKHERLVVNLPENLPPVYGNSMRLRQMASNLIENAIKYTPEGGVVTVICIQDSDQLILTITDTGIGIPISDQPYIFDKFYRAKSVPEEIPGTGLGLSIVKSIIENHGGRIWVDSKPEHGTTFVVVLPMYDEKKAAVRG
jgi:two-component system, OmpR family, phosphate regulon sensor histidine kinase PhoR